MCELERTQHPSLGLYLKRMSEGTRREAGHNGQVTVGASGACTMATRVRLTWGFGRPPGGPAAVPLWLLSSNSHMEDDHGVLGQSFARKDVQINFQKILKLRKYFWYFWKKEKVLEKFQHAKNDFENFKYAVGKNK